MSGVKSLPLGKKLLISLLAFGLGPVLIFGSLFWVTASSELNSRLDGEMSLLRDTRRERIEAWFSGIELQLRRQAADPSMAGAIYAFSDGFNRLGKGDSDAATARLQQVYIAENPHPVGAKDQLVSAPDGSFYSEVHARVHPWLHELQRSLEYYDLFLVNLEGQVVYTVFKEVDFGTNLMSGPYSGTGLAEAFRAVRDDAGDRVYLSDWAPYAPSNDDPAAFIGAPVFDAGQKVGVLLYQMSLARINGILHERTTLGTDGEMYLAGADGLLRSDSGLNTALTLVSSFRKGLRIPAAQGALASLKAGEPLIYSGEGLSGRPSLVYAAPVTALNQTWFLFVERTLDSAYGLITTLEWVLAAVLVLTGVVLSLGAWWLSRSIGNPVQESFDALNRISGQFAAISRQLAASSQQMADGASQQASALEETSASITEVAAAAKEHAGAATSAREIAESMQRAGLRGQADLESIRQAIQSMTEAAGRSSVIIKNIDEIAFQTQLLSLNAAVEAARAGSVGLGFAVVADEVRALALRSTNAAKETEMLISGSREASARSMDELNRFAAVLEVLLADSARITTFVNEISGGTLEQAEGTDQISRAVNQSERIVQANAATAEEMASSAHEMRVESEHMLEAILKLKTVVHGGG